MRIKLYTVLFLIIYTLSACLEDKGNYIYQDINEVSVSDIDKSKFYNRIAFVERLTIDPSISNTLGNFNENNYEYTWKLIPMGKDFRDVEEGEDFVVCKTKKIDIFVTHEPGDYQGFFIVKDKSTEVSWYTQFNLRVKSITSEGWLVLCQKQGQPRMDIVFNSNAEEDLVALDIWRENHQELGMPKKLFYNYSNFTGRTACLMLTDKTTYHLDEKDLHAGEDNNLIWKFGITPENVKVKGSGISLYSINNLWVIVNEKGEIYSLDRDITGGIFEFPINKIDGKETFEAAPFVGVNLDNASGMNGREGCVPALLYDNTNKQFMVIRNNASYPSVITFSGKHLFDAKTGKDIVHMEPTKHGLIYSILRDPNSKRLFFYGIDLKAKYKEPVNWWDEPTYEEYNLQEYYGEVKGSEQEYATAFACHHQFPYLFYLSNNKIYQFDMGNPDEEAKMVLELPGEEIRVLKFNPFVAWERYEEWERLRTYQLIVGSNVEGKDESDCGVMRVYDVPNLMKPLVKKKEFKGLGKIVDITYKERTKR